MNIGKIKARVIVPNCDNVLIIKDINDIILFSEFLKKEQICEKCIKLLNKDVLHPYNLINIIIVKIKRLFFDDPTEREKDIKTIIYPFINEYLDLIYTNIQNGKYILIRSDCRMFIVDPLNILDITNNIEVNIDEIKNFFFSNNMPSLETGGFFLNASSDMIPFCISEDSTIHTLDYVNKAFMHSDIILALDIDEDIVNKYQYLTTKHVDHFSYSQYGIPGLKNSEAYEEVEKPFVVTEEHLEKIKSFIDKVEKEVLE